VQQVHQTFRFGEVLFERDRYTESLNKLWVVGFCQSRPTVTLCFMTAASEWITSACPPEILRSALGRAFKLLVFGSGAGLLLGILASRVLAFIVYQATPHDPLVLACTVLAMSLLGLVATWIPAQRALSIDPATLLREE